MEGHIAGIVDVSFLSPFFWGGEGVADWVC